VEHPSWCAQPACDANDATKTGWHASAPHSARDDDLDTSYTVGLVASPSLANSGLIELTQRMPAADETDPREDIAFVFTPTAAVEVGQALAATGERALQEVLPGPFPGSG
jgi:hypothetical protein